MLLRIFVPIFMCISLLCSKLKCQLKCYKISLVDSLIKFSIKCFLLIFFLGIKNQSDKNIENHVKLNSVSPELKRKVRIHIHA